MKNNVFKNEYFKNHVKIELVIYSYRLTHKRKIWLIGTIPLHQIFNQFGGLCVFL